MAGETTGRLDWIRDELAKLEQAGLRRRRPERQGPQAAEYTVDGQRLVSFGSNDYLGLAADPRLADAVAGALHRELWGSGASPLLGGFAEGHRRLERQLAQFEGTPAALLFSSGFAANAGTIAALVGPGDGVFTDSKNHASLLDGCRLSRADVRAYPHADAERLDRLLARSPHRRKLIVTDSLFSMGGDFAPLRDLADVAERRGAMLMVDEAHATGVFGPGGRGVAELLNVENRIDVRIGTLSKALGSVGGFAVGSEPLIQWMVNRARPYIFSTAPPAAIAAAATAALQIVRDEPQRRQALLTQAASLRMALTEQGWNTGQSVSQIVPLIVGTPQRAVELSRQLRENSLFVPAIRPPTVPEGEACLRISVTYGHTATAVEGLLKALARLR